MSHQPLKVDYDTFSQIEFRPCGRVLCVTFYVGQRHTTDDGVV